MQFLFNLLFSIISATVIQLTDENFDDEINSTEYGFFLKFFVPWCGHCQELVPIWKDLDKSILKLDLPVLIGEINCEENPGLKQRFSDYIKGYPTIGFYRDDELRIYSNYRRPEEFIRYLRRVTEDPVVITTKKSWETDLKRYEVSFLFYGSQDIFPVQYNQFFKVAQRMQGIVGFLQTTDAKLMDKNIFSEKLIQPSLIKVSLSGDNYIYDGFTDDDDDEEHIYIWILKNKLPLISEVTPYTYREITEGGLRAVFAILDPDNPLNDQFLMLFRSNAELLSGSFIFATIDGVKYSEFTTKFGVYTGDMPSIIVFDREASQYWKPESPHKFVTTHQINTFLNDVLSGKIPAHGPGWLGQAIRWIGGMSETNGLIFGVALTVLSAIVLIWCFKDLESRGNEEENDVTIHKTKNETKKQKSKKNSKKNQ